MIVTTSPVVILDGADCWRLVHRRSHAEVVQAIERLAAQHGAEVEWRRQLQPAAKVAADLGISADAMRKRLRRGTWPGQLLAHRWHAVPPGAPGAPPSSP